MKIYRYPLLCWNITDNLICGRLVGTDYEMVNAHLSKLKAHFSDHLQREYAQDLSLPDPLTGARLKKINVKVRPSYEEKKGIFPVGHFINISVTAIFGSLQEEYSECYLPLLEQHFYFYQTDQLRPLIEHFARDHFNNMTPEDFYHYLMLPDPWLEEITVRIKPRTLENVFNKRNQDNIKTLLKIADKFPRKIKTSNIAPETAWERRRIVTQIVKKLEHERLCIVLIGEQGSGKTTILLEVARKFFSVTKASRQEGKYLWRTTPQRMIAGARYLGEWQETSEELMEELESTGDILWINNFVHLLAVGGEGPEDSIAAFMLPQLRQGVQIVSELTQQEWERVRQRLPAFAAHFHVITIPQLTKKQVFRILHLFSDYIDKQLHITIEESALYLAYRLLDRYVRYEAFPGKIITFLTSIINDMLVLNQKIINNEKVIKQFIQKTGLPSFLLRDDIPLDISALQNYFTENIIGQKQAIVQICEIIMVFKAGVNDPNKPIATLLFSGPTGVGKTACVRSLAQYFFGKGQTLNPLIRLDMSEFQHPIQVDRILGSGEKPGKLIRDVRERPFSVVLLDEIEKAHPIFFDLLLNVMDEGILIDGNGRVTDFRNVILIMTSNLGSRKSKRISFVNKTDKHEVSGAVRSFFRPEFYNRIDQVITFQALDKTHMRDITCKELALLNKREGFQERGITLKFTDTLIDYIAEEGFEAEYGARPLQRTIERWVVAQLAEFLLEHLELKNITVQVDWDVISKSVILNICNEL